jgi:hypothetical protein
VSSANKLGDFFDILNNMQMSLSMGSGKPKPGSGEECSCRTSLKAAGLVIKLKKEWRNQKAGEGKTENWGSRQKKERMVFMEVWEKSMRRLCRYTRNRSRLHEALENELNKQGLGGSGQNVLEKEIENKY